MAIIVYSKPACVYCDKAKALLTRLGYDYTEKVVTKDISLEMACNIPGHYESGMVGPITIK